MMATHPFDPLTPGEMTKAADIVRSVFPDRDLHFRFVTLQEPTKADMLAFLEREHLGQPLDPRPARLARVQVMVGDEDEKSVGGSRLFELLVDLDAAAVARREHLAGRHAFIDPAYMRAVERACLADDRVQAAVRALDLPATATVVVEPWAYATDGIHDMSERITMCWFYMRLVDDPNANHYAYPLDLCAEVSERLCVTAAYPLPATTARDKDGAAATRPFDQQRIQPPAATEYHPSLRPAPRSSTRPLRSVQPEGPSFRTAGRLVRWEGWSLRVGFNYREGLTLHDVRFAGRSLFYRLSLAEMFVPYGDPRAPYPRKGAFDVGNDGAGINANDLRLGCDCLGGAVRYWDAWLTGPDGRPVRLPNAVCCHEQDDGILWKHTSRAAGADAGSAAVVARARVLVLQSIVTVSNYEYAFSFHLGQDASLRFEVRATGIVSTSPVDDLVRDDGSHPYGTVVAPGVLAQNHQHLFCLRIDPAVDGSANSLRVDETEALPMTDDEDGGVYANPLGVGFVTRSTVLEHETGLDLDVAADRTFTVVNEARRHPATGTPVGVRLVPHYSQLLLAHPRSFHARRAEFAHHAVWLTRYRDDDLFPAGRHTMQSLGGEGIASGIEARKEEGAARDCDIVLWHTFGSTHLPRAEDWPVMPAEKMVVELKPVNFFERNPALDVAAASQEVNQSVLVEEGEE